MVAYVVGKVFVTNDAFAEEYRPKVKALVEKHGGKIVAASGPENLEGERSLPDWLVIIQFPDMDTGNAHRDHRGDGAKDEIDAEE